MMRRWALSAAMSLAAALPAMAAPPQLAFSHKDWHLACDNTRTCRAAGYSIQDGESPVASVLLTRAAGPGQAVTVQLKILPEPVDQDRTAPLVLAMHTGAGAHGSVSVDAAAWSGTLSAPQVQALLAALPGNAEPVWTGAGKDWQVSTAGANAVLLKMDEFQGRTGTPGALVRKGDKPEGSVLPALAPPVVVVPPLPRGARERQLPAAMTKALLPLLLKDMGEDGCDMLEHPEPDEEEGERQALPRLDAAPLSHGKLLVSALCYRAAYNAGTAYWVINERPPYRPELVTAQGNAYANGILDAIHKGRGLGDCWEQEQWAWDGRRFVQTLIADGGPCRLVPGGWDLPTFVATVRHVGRSP